MRGLIGSAAIIAAVTFVVGLLGSLLATEANLAERLMIAVMPAAMAFFAALTLGWRDCDRHTRTVRAVRRVLLARQDVTMEEFSAHFPDCDSTLMAQTREAISQFFDVPVLKIHPTDKLRDDFQFDSLEPSFHSFVVHHVLNSRNVAPGPFTFNTTDLDDAGDLANEIQRVLDGFASRKAEDQGMGSGQSHDPQLIEETRQQILMLVDEITQLARSDIAPEEFYREFLPRVVAALAAAGGAVWVAEDRGRLALEYQINLQQTQLGESEENQIVHGRLLQRVLAAGEGALVPAHSGYADDEQGGNPSNFLLVLAPLRAGEETVGVVEVFQRPDTRPATQHGYLRFLTQMCGRASEFFGSR